jgi:5-carboxymethyl-2-hydroxymuconate isomerase
MPHLFVEYSANIEERMQLDTLLDRLYEAGLASGVFPIGGIRVRAHRVDRYRIADCAPENAFVHVTALLGHGRPLDVRRRVGEQLFEVLKTHFQELYEESPLAISFNIQELHPELNFKHNNLHEYVARRRAAREGKE